MNFQMCQQIQTGNVPIVKNVQIINKAVIKKKMDQDLNMNRLRIFWINIVRCVVKQNQLKNSGFVDEKKMDIMSIVSNAREN